MFGKVNKRNNYNSINILVIADCHHLKEEEIEKVKNLQYDVCLLLGDISVRVYNQI